MSHGLKSTLQAVVAACLVCLWPNMAFGQRVVLVRPSDSSVTLSEAFNRLRGELALHGFDVAVLEAREAPSPRTLASTADQGGAVASVSFVEAHGTAAVDIWISDRVTGKTSFRTITTQGAGDAATLLALRAAELLRASLREYGPENEVPPDVSGASPERSDEVVTAWAAVPPSPTYWWLGASGTIVVSLPEVALAAGPELAVGWQHRRWGVQALLSGPTLGARYEATAAQARLRSLTALFAGSFDVVATQPASLAVVPVFGAAYLSVAGEGDPPFVGRDDTAWVGAFGGGVQATLRIGAQLHLIASSRALALVPAPIVEVGDEEARVGRPLVCTSLGARVTF